MQAKAANNPGMKLLRARPMPIQEKHSNRAYWGSGSILPHQLFLPASLVVVGGGVGYLRPTVGCLCANAVVVPTGSAIAVINNLQDLASKHVRARDFRSALPLIEQAVTAARRAFKWDDPKLAQCLNNLGEPPSMCSPHAHNTLVPEPPLAPLAGICRAETGEFDGAIEAHEECLRIRRSTVQWNDLSLAR
jgi:hypothetical protein